MKDQFQSTEILRIRLPAFISKATGLFITDGTDACTISVRKPDGSSATYDALSTPAVAWDSVVKMWTLDIPVLDYLQGEWKVYAVSDAADTLPRWSLYDWGDYVDDISTTKTDVAAVSTKLGTPAGVSVVADIAAVEGSLAADIAAVESSLGGDIAGLVSSMADLSDQAFGRWKIQGSQLILYRESDEETPWRAYDLYDDAGTASGVRVFERRPA